MRNILLGALAGLAMGAVGAFAYDHYLGVGQQLAQVQTELALANTSLAKTHHDSQELKSETDALSAQVQQLTSTKEDLTHQLDALKKVSAAATETPNPTATMVKAATTYLNQQKLQLLIHRLHLTPEQEAAVKTAMNSKSSIDQTLDEILMPEQKTAYEQMKTDEKINAAETTSASETNQMATLLQLTDSQKDQVYSALYQVQMNMQDPVWIKNNIPASSDPTAMNDAQAKANEATLANILTPDQLATYHQQAQSDLELLKTWRQKILPTMVTPAAAPAHGP